MKEGKSNIKGLDENQVATQRVTFGSNALTSDYQSGIRQIIKEIVLEPMFLLLICTAVIYFILGEIHEGILMIVALFFVAGISLYQEQRSRNAVDSLKKLSSSKAKVLRSGKLLEIYSDDLVVGDIIMAEDGNLVSADAEILEAHDFSVNESILTGESLPVFKSTTFEQNRIYKGTQVLSGTCTARVLAVGQHSEIGKIGALLDDIKVVRTPLQLQIRKFTTFMVVFGMLAFILVVVLTYLQTHQIAASLLKGMTLAMSVLPEEIPVAFSTFMALGAYHMFKKGVIAKNPYTVETLGASTVICADKTGTLTQNIMELVAVYDMDSNRLFDFTTQPFEYCKVLELAMWASEPDAIDKMEIQLHQVFGQVATCDRRPTSSLVKEYPLGGSPPMMTHVFKHSDASYTIAVKGSVEGILKQSTLNTTEIELILKKVEQLAYRGFRVLGVGEVVFNGGGALPEEQSSFVYDFAGVVAFYDPPKENIQQTLEVFYKAGIDVKMITGDHAHTATSIAKMTGIHHAGSVMEGEEIMKTEMAKLQLDVKTINVFARMFPAAKLKIIEALKANGEVVAMTGDGVNDGPALKAAHIGIAMGLGGSEVAKSAAGLVLMDDNLLWMTDSIALGRRIYENLKKAIRYIISIHIPIILIVALPMFFYWSFTDIFTPVHVIFLELIMGPTCSVIYENEPGEKLSMLKAPRKLSENFFSFKELSLSILQGLAITAACLGLGYYLIQLGEEGSYIRTMVYTTLIFSNVFLTLENRSFYHSILFTLRYKNNLIPLVIGVSVLILMLSIYTLPLRDIFSFVSLGWVDLLVCLTASFIGVMWIEIYKLYLRQTPLK